MSEARFISSFTIQTLVNDQIVVDYNGAGDEIITIPAGTYYWSCDGGADDFATVLQTALTAAWLPVVTTWMVHVIGLVIMAPPGFRDGQIYLYEDNHNYKLSMMSPDWTLDPRIMGWPGTADETSVDGILLSDWIHRYGWYPRDFPIEDVVKIVANNAVEVSSGRYIEGVSWGEFTTRSLAFDCVPSAFVRIAAAADATRATEVDIVTGDLNCAWECFASDLACDCGRDWRYYPDIEEYDADEFYGPYVFPPDSALWIDPLGLSMVQETAGELWTVAFSGIEAIS